MDAAGTLRIVLDVALIALAALAGWGVVEFARASRSARMFADEMSRTVPPVVEHADETLVRADAALDSLRAELTRVNGVVTSLEEVSGRVNSTTRAVEEIVEAPAAAVSGVAMGLRSFFSVLTGRRL